MVVGSLALDRLERDGRMEHRLGGVATYGGLTAARLGCRVEAWSGMPSALVEEVQRRLVGVRFVGTDTAQPTRFVNREVAGGEREQACPTQARMLRAEDWPFDARARWDWIHLGPLHPRDLGLDVVRELRRRCGVLSLDVQGYTRRIAGDGAVLPEVAAELAEVLRLIDWLKASEAEWEAVAQRFAWSPAQAVERHGWTALLVSRGARGGTLHASGRSVDWRAEVPEHVALETGAGDVFTTSCITRTLQGDEAIEDALAFAAHIAGRHVAGAWLDLDSLRLSSWGE